MFLTEEFNMFVTEPIFERMFHLNPIVPPILLVCVLFIPVGYVIIKTTYFSEPY